MQLLQFDFKGDRLILGGEKNLPLEGYRNFLLHRWHWLVNRHQTATIVVEGKPQKGYDWATIFILASEFGAPVQEYLLSHAALEHLS